MHNMDEDPEVRPEFETMKTEVIRSLVSRFEKFSTWKALVRAFNFLRRFCRMKEENIGHSITELKETEKFLIKRTQEDYFINEIHCLQHGKSVSSQNTSGLETLNPFLDFDGIKRVGGRLREAPIGFEQQHPILVPKKSHLALLLVRHYH